MLLFALLIPAMDGVDTCGYNSVINGQRCLASDCRSQLVSILVMSLLVLLVR